VELNGLRHHLLEWGEGDEVVILCHGFLDHGASFRDVGASLAARGFRAVAFDFRGHGETEWIGRGGYYHFPDYAMDLEALVEHLGLERFHLVGHSMGGTVASMYAGIRPSRIKSLVLVEGIGPPPSDLDGITTRFAGWLDGVARVRKRKNRAMPSLADAVARLRAAHPDLDEPLALYLAEKGTREIEGGYAWRWDPMHQTMSPVPFRLEIFTRFLASIVAPTLFVVGSRGMRLPDEDARLAHVKDARKIELADVGHMIHWFRAEELASLIAEHAAGR
jgi:pimeloyl-ACP methyl ester carboxylesterase